MPAAPPAAAEAAILAPYSTITRRVEIYQEDGTTLFKGDAYVTGGSVSVSYGRPERRSFELTLDNVDGSLDNYPGGFWYDKIIKVYRGVTYSGGSWETQLGEFMIDQIETQNFPHTVQVQGRDYTKKLMLSKFPQATAFNQGQKVVDVIKVIAQNGGITKFVFPNTVASPFDSTLGTTWAFERTTSRWDAIDKLAQAFNYEVFFDSSGYMVLRAFQDPVTSPESYTFETGQYGNLARYTKRANDSRIYNHVVVTGNQDAVPLPWAEAINNESTSPTNVTELGDRLYFYTSAFITTTAQAQTVADRFLSVHSLEVFDLSMESIVLPWLEVGEIVRFVDPDPNPGDPDRFLLTDFAVPLALGSMSLTAKRVTVV